MSKSNGFWIGCVLAVVCVSFASRAQAPKNELASQVQLRESAQGPSVSDLASFLGVSSLSFNLSTDGQSAIEFSYEVWKGGRVAARQKAGRLGPPAKSSLAVLWRETRTSIEMRFIYEGASFDGAFGTSIPRLDRLSDMSARTKWVEDALDLKLGSREPIFAMLMNQDAIEGISPTEDPVERMKSCELGIVFYATAVRRQGG